MTAEPLDPVHLRTLVSIADTGGFRRAADALHLSQPAVSQHVRSLERRLNQTLLVKDGRSSRFTPDGERLVNEARRLLTAHEQALHRLQVDDVGELTIGSSEHAADRVLPDLLGALRAAYSHVRLQFRLDRSTSLGDAVDKGTLDLAVVLGSNDAEILGTEVGRLDLRWVAAETWCAPETGAALPVVAFAQPCGLRNRAVRGLYELGHDVDVAVEATTLDGVLVAARAGLGVALLPFAGAVPDGLREPHDLAPMGDIDLRLVARRALAPEIENTAVAALRAHFGAIAHADTRGFADTEKSARSRALRGVA